MREKILATKSVDELVDIETEVISTYRDNFYNDLLKDDDIKKHFCKLFDVEEEALKNALMIDGNPPIDDFEK